MSLYSTADGQVALLREVKPWPGDVDVEDIPQAAGDGPSTENPEA